MRRDGGEEIPAVSTQNLEVLSEVRFKALHDAHQLIRASCLPGWQCDETGEELVRWGSKRSRTHRCRHIGDASDTLFWRLTHQDKCLAIYTPSLRIVKLQMLCRQVYLVEDSQRLRNDLCRPHSTVTIQCRVVTARRTQEMMAVLSDAAQYNVAEQATHQSIAHLDA